MLQSNFLNPKPQSLVSFNFAINLDSKPQK